MLRIYYSEIIAKRLFFVKHLLLKSFQKLLSCLLIARFSKQCKHIFFVALHPRLVKWIYTKQISADPDSKLKEVE